MVLNALPACAAPLGPNQVVNPSCLPDACHPRVSRAVAARRTAYRKSFDNWLPSFNVRFGLDDKKFVRFAYSRAIARPDIGLLRNFVQINAPVINTGAELAIRGL